MNQLKFELSVLFAKTELCPYSRNGQIIPEYKKFFGKEVTDEDLDKILGEIINDQVEMYNNFVQEIPEDYELHDRDG